MFARVLNMLPKNPSEMSENTSGKLCSESSVKSHYLKVWNLFKLNNNNTKIRWIDIFLAP